METFLARFREPLVLSLAVLALLGWLIVLFVGWSGSTERSALAGRLASVEQSRAQLAADFEAREGAAGSLQQFRQDIETGEKRVAELAAQIGERDAELGALTATVAEANAALAAGTGGLKAAEAQLAEVRQRLTAVTDELTAAELSITDRTNELTEVGQRLEAARGDEANVRATIAQLSAEAATSSEQVADVEQRLQDARAAEANAQNQIAEAQRLQDEILARQAGLETAIADLEERRTSLTGEIDVAEGERTELQSQVEGLTTTLAQRSEQLAALEQKIGELQGTLDEVESAGAAGLVAGDYSARFAASDPVTLTATFRPDGSFELSQVLAIPGQANAASIAGRYVVADGQLTLSEATGEVGSATFPMACTIAPAAPGFLVVVDNDRNCTLEGLTFTPR